MSNINRDYLIILDVKSGEVDSPNIYYFNTDKNTSNLYVQMVLRETTVEATPIDNATNYSIKANILKPNMVAKEVEGTLVNPEKAIYEFALPADCTDFSGNAKIEFEVYTGDKIATSFATKFKVHGSVLTEQNKYIEDSSDYPILKELMAEVKVINETARELDTTIRTLQADMIEANNEMKANESERQSNEVSRQTNESNRITAEETRARNEVLRETNEDTRIANEQQRIINEDKRKLEENTRNSNEDYRIENESNRVTAESNRAAAENTRVNKEVLRETNESNRAAAEEIRKANEQARITAETARVTEHEQMRTELNEVKAENAILMENDKKQADRMTQVEISDKRQYVIMEGLMNSAGDGYLKIEDTGNDTTLYNSVEGFVDVKNITGNTMVNSIKNSDDEFTLNGDINTSGQSVTLTTAVDNGQVDVLAEGNTMVNVCDQKDPVAITTDTNTFPLRYLYTSTEYTLQFESDTAVTIDITLGGYTLSSQNIVIGLNKINIITPNELTDNNLILNGTGFSASNIVVTEATDKDFGYFSGMKSVGELEENKIEILSHNKNYLDVANAFTCYIGNWGSSIIDKDHPHGTLTINGNSITLTDNRQYTYVLIPCEIKKDEEYYIHFEVDVPFGAGYLCLFTDLKSKRTLTAIRKSGTNVFISPIDAKYIGFSVNSNYPTAHFNNLYINRYNDSGYVAPAENKKQILLNEPLRSVGDTKDRFVQIDGKWYVERNCLLPSQFYNNYGNLGQYDSDDATGLYNVFRLYQDNYEAKIISLLPKVSWSEFVNIDKSVVCVTGKYIYIKTPKGLYTRDTILTYMDNMCILKSPSPTYEPVEISPVLNTYTDVTHITNNSTIPMNMPVVNSGYECIIKPSTKYTVVGITNGRIGDSTIVNGTITTPATITDNFLRPYGTGKTSKVMLLEGEPAHIPGYFKGIKSVFEDMKVTDEADENFGKYAVEVKVVGKNKVNQDSGVLNQHYGGKVVCFPVKPNTTYVYTSSKYLGAVSVFELNTFLPPDSEMSKVNKLYIKQNILRSGERVTTSSRTKYIFMNYDKDSNIQIEEGTVASEYEPYHETKQTLYLDEPLYNTNNITIYNDKLGYWKNWDIRDYQDGDFGTYLTDMTKTVYQLAEPVFVPLIDNCPNFVIGSWDNCSIHFDSIIPLSATRYRYTGNVPSVISLNEEVSTVSDISDEQDALLVDMATELAVMKLTM